MSSEYEVSMRTGAAVLRALQSLEYPYKDVTITKTGDWLVGGRRYLPEQVLQDIDVVFIALHGEHGEDGRLQRYLTNHQIPYTGSRALASATALNKAFTKRLVQAHGITTPRFALFDERNTAADSNFHSLLAFGTELVIKPVAAGSSVDTLVGVPLTDVPNQVRSLLSKYETVMVEECIRGKELTVGILEQFRDQDHFVLPPIEIKPLDSHMFYSYDAKYGGQTELVCPASLSDIECSQLQDLATSVHRLLDLRHYSRSDFIVQDGQAYFLEINTLPGLTKTSLFPRALQTAGVEYDELVAHLIDKAAH